MPLLHGLLMPGNASAIATWAERQRAQEDGGAIRLRARQCPGLRERHAQPDADQRAQ